MNIFPYLIALLDFGATIVYLFNRQWALAITWACYGIAAISLGQVRSGAG